MVYRINYIIITVFIAILFSACGQQNSEVVEEPTPGTSQDSVQTLMSPDGKVQLVLDVPLNGRPVYALRFGNEQLLRPSSLGLLLFSDDALSMDGAIEHVRFDRDFEVVQATHSSFEETWEPVWGQRSVIQNNYNALLVELRQPGTNRLLTVEFRAFNDGVGFRYHIPAQPAMDSLSLFAEGTGFHFAGNFDAWWQPQNFDSYEALYQHTNIGTVEAANTPMTLQTETGTTLAIHEANLTNYPGATLEDAWRKLGASKPTESDRKRSRTDFSIRLVPGRDSVLVRAALPFSTPWRTIQVASSPAALAESNLILNLNEPCAIESTDWIEPMTYVGIWWGMHLGVTSWEPGSRHGATTESCKAYIDFAAINGIRGVLVEGWNTGWENWGARNAFDQTTACDDFDLEYLATYAQEKGVALIGHHETGGDAVSYEARMDSAFAQCQRLGIKAVKTGYAGGIYPRGEYHHGKYMVEHYRNVVETAAHYGIMIDAHEPIKPTGLERTWPNMMTREGVRGMEWNAWSSGNPPDHTCILPFTRGLAGPIDYTPGIMDILYQRHTDREFWNNPAAMDTARVHTTLAKQLALFVVLYSPLQMASDLVENYENPAVADAVRFISTVPATWDETRFIDGKIGEYVVVARRSGTTWYVAAITNGESRTVTCELPLSKNVSYLGEVYSDAVDTDLESNPTAYDYQTFEYEGDPVFKFEMKAGSGRVFVFTQ